MENTDLDLSDNCESDTKKNTSYECVELNNGDLENVVVKKQSMFSDTPNRTSSKHKNGGECKSTIKGMDDKFEAFKSNLGRNL